MAMSSKGVVDSLTRAARSAGSQGEAFRMGKTTLMLGILCSPMDLI
jgi:hypothetical protein